MIIFGIFYGILMILLIIYNNAYSCFLSECCLCKYYFVDYVVEDYDWVYVSEDYDL